MAVTKISLFTCVLCVIVGILISGSNVVSDKLECDLKALSVCWDYVKKEGQTIPPSPECCDELTKTDYTCICQHTPPDVCKSMSKEKVFYVADYCKKPIVQPCGACVQ